MKTVIGEGVEYIADAFSNSGIETINMPKLRIMNGGFQECKSLKSFNLPEGLIVLQNDVFKNATNMTSVYIPSAVLSFGQNCFTGCSALQTISVANPTPIEINENNFDGLTYLSATLKVPAGSKAAYMKAPVWNNFGTIEEDPSLQCNNAVVFIPIKDEEDENGTIKINVPEPYSPLEGYGYYTYGDYYVYVLPIGTEITFIAKPKHKYMLSSFEVNDNDVWSQVKDNKYVYTVTKSETINYSASFAYDIESGLEMYVGETINILRLLFGEYYFYFNVKSVVIEDKTIAKFNIYGEAQALKEGTTQCTMTIDIQGEEYVLPFDIIVKAPLYPVSATQETTFDFSEMKDLEGSDQMSVSLGENDIFNEEEGRLEFTSIVTEEEVTAALENTTPGTSDFKNQLPSSMTFILQQGDGDIEIDCQILSGFELQVKIGDAESVTISSCERDKAVVHYDVIENTYVVIYLTNASSTDAPDRMRALTNSEIGAYIYAVKIIPSNAETGIDEILQYPNTNTQKLLMNGQLLILRDGKAYTITGQKITY